MHRFWHSFLLLAVALCVQSCGRQQTAQEAAQEFFQRVAKGETQQAHASGAFAFQAEQNERVFAQAAKEQGLIGATNILLEPVETDDKEAKFNAVVSTARGEKKTYIATLQKDGGKWRMFSLRTPRNPATGKSENVFSLVGKTASFSDALSQPLPDDKTVRKMIAATLTRFNDAVAQQSFADFYANISVSWQTQVTERQLQRAFQPFIDQKVNIAGALALEPILDSPPQISTEGLLLVSGRYPSKPYNVEFTLKYIYELPDWKLFGLDVNLRKPPEE